MSMHIHSQSVAKLILSEMPTLLVYHELCFIIPGGMVAAAAAWDPLTDVVTFIKRQFMSKKTEESDKYG